MIESRRFLVQWQDGKDRNIREVSLEELATVIVELVEQAPLQTLFATIAERYKRNGEGNPGNH